MCSRWCDRSGLCFIKGSFIDAIISIIYVAYPHRQSALLQFNHICQISSPSSILFDSVQHPPQPICLEHYAPSSILYLARSCWLHISRCFNCPTGCTMRPSARVAAMASLGHGPELRRWFRESLIFARSRGISHSDDDITVLPLASFGLQCGVTQFNLRLLQNQLRISEIFFYWLHHAHNDHRRSIAQNAAPCTCPQGLRITDAVLLSDLFHASTLPAAINSSNFLL